VNTRQRIGNNRHYLRFRPPGQSQLPPLIRQVSTREFTTDLPSSEGNGGGGCAEHTDGT
jgi:hypothetical protein